MNFKFSKVNGHPDLFSSNFPTKFGSSENISIPESAPEDAKQQNLPNIIEETPIAQQDQE